MRGAGQQEGGRGIFLPLFSLRFLGVPLSVSFHWAAIVCCRLQLSPCSQNLPASCLRLQGPRCCSSRGRSSRSKRPLLQALEVPAVAGHCPTLRPESQLYVALTQLPIVVTPASSLRVEAASCLSRVISVFHFSFLALQHL
uniref:Uncharacterized protein n=1 Tax=Molossus molossus TaxID=27622 RepID=A0A7J8I9P2_MOLMO|nr:hypothetical protein HJG59_010679 [Molossus molossus]